MGRGQGTAVAANDQFSVVFGNRRGTQESDKEILARLGTVSGLPEMVSVAERSTNVDAVGYDAGLRWAFIQFKSSEKYYVYADVSPEVYAGILSAPSIGRYIRNVLMPNSRHFDRKTGLVSAHPPKGRK